MNIDESKASLCSVEDMINSAVSIDENRVNYKMIQAIFHLMARQMRLLKSQVDLRICDPTIKKHKKMEDITSSSSSTISSTASPTRRAEKEKKAKDKAEKAAREAKEKAEAAEREAARARKKEEEAEEIKRKLASFAQDAERPSEEICSADLDFSDMERTGIERTAEQKAARKKEKDAIRMGVDKYKADMEKGVEPTDKDKTIKDRAEIDVSKKQVGAEKDKEDEKAGAEEEGRGGKKKYKGKKGSDESSDSKSKRPKKKRKGEDADEGSADEGSADEGERAKKEKLGKMSPEERKKFEVEEEEREKQKMDKMSPKERKKYEKEKKMEKERVDKMSEAEREQYEKKKEEEIEEMGRMSPEERDRREKEKLDKISPKEKKKEEEIEKMGGMSPEERNRREKEKLDKMSPKEKKKYEKEQQQEKEMLDKMSPSQRDVFEREKEREIEKVAQMSPKERDKYNKEKEKERQKIEKMSPEERDDYEREAQAEREKMDKMSPSERDKYEKEKGEIAKMSPKERDKYEKQKRASRTPSGTGISIKESDRKGDKILVVEKGPTTYGTGRLPRVGSVDCVTRSEFELLEAAVNALKRNAGPLPMPAMPGNKKLLDDIAKGSASLTDTMEAMQMAARLQAAEKAIERMADLLTQLAASGTLPQDVVKKIGTVTAGLSTLLPGEGDDRSRYGVGQSGGKSVAISEGGGTPGMKSARLASPGSTKASGRSSLSSRVSTSGTAHVTRDDLGDAMDSLTDDLKNYLASILAKAQANCESAAASVKSIEDKMILAIKLNGRLGTLYSLVTDYSQQLHGFDAGLGTQMAGFQEQMTVLSKDLKGGLQLLENANNNAETAALLELNERYESLLTELDGVLNNHGKMNMYQRQLEEELRSLLANVEILQEQKSDRDEVLDALRDKADSAQLKGLLTEEAFTIARSELEDRLDQCYDKFNKQEIVWTDALKDLADLSAQKAELIQLLAAKDDAQTQLRALQEQLDQLALALGEPMAAIVTRQVSKNATCGPCMVPALQGPIEKSYGMPAPLPPARPAPLGQEEPCTKNVRPEHPPDDRLHICHRWVGGSHTLVTDAVRRVKAPSTITEHVGPAVKIYAGQGTDGRLYTLEKELVPCAECNQCYRDRRAGEDPLGNTHREVCLEVGGEQDKGKMPEEAQPSPDVAAGAGDTGG